MTAERGKSLDRQRRLGEGVLRKKTAPGRELIGRVLVEKFDLTANQVTAAGLLGTVIGTALYVRNSAKPEDERWSPLLSTAVTGGSRALDGIDGMVNDLRGDENPYGFLVDLIADRGGELTTALGRAISAHRRGNRLGYYATLAKALTNVGSSLARAGNEMSGRQVPETGKGLVALFGSSVGRTALDLAAMTFDHAQPYLDLLGAAANVHTTAQRTLNLRQPPNQSKPVSEEDKRKAKQRLIALTATTAAFAVGTYLVHSRLENKESPAGQT